MSIPIESRRIFGETEEIARLKGAVVGIGGAGCSMINNLRRLGITEMKLIAVNTDVASLRSIKADYKFLAGESFLGGRSARTIENGRRAMEEVADRVITAIGDSELVFILSGLGGGAGTGGHIALLEYLKDRMKEALTISFVTLPFSSEGEVRIRNAQLGLSEILDLSDVTLVAFNDVLRQKYPNLPLVRAYRIVDQRIADIIRGIWALQQLDPLPGMPNVDFAVMKNLAKNSGLGMAGLGEGSNVKVAFEAAIQDPFGDADIRGCKGIVGYIEGPETLISTESITYVQESLTRNLRIPESYFGLKPGMEMHRSKIFVFAFSAKSRMVETYLSGVSR